MLVAQLVPLGIELWQGEAKDSGHKGVHRFGFHIEVHPQEDLCKHILHWDHRFALVWFVVEQAIGSDYLSHVIIRKVVPWGVD